MAVTFIICLGLIYLIPVIFLTHCVIRYVPRTRRVLRSVLPMRVSPVSPVPLLLGGGPPHVSSVPVSVLRPFTVVHGTFNQLYDDDRVDLIRLSSACPIIPSDDFLRIYLREVLPTSFTVLARAPLSEVRSSVARLCCLSRCVTVYALFSRPENSTVNPFHIDRVALGLLTRPDVVPVSRAPVPPCPAVSASSPLSDSPTTFIPVAVPVGVRPTSTLFPPPPLTLHDRAELVNDWCRSVSGSQLHEFPCVSYSPVFNALRFPLHSSSQSVQLAFSDPLFCSAGVVPDNPRVASNNIPPMSLRNSRWLGEIPVQLCGLTFMEKILISRYRHNRCIVRVDMHAPYKMRANAVVFAQPVGKVLSVLPMPKTELDSIVAVLFTGSVAPTVSDFQRTPVFPTGEGDPVATLGVSDSALPSGTDSGVCPLSVHGVTEEDLVTMSFNEQASRAMYHLKAGGGVLSVGSRSSPESIYDNPELFPGLFPWLYPYGLGGPESPRKVDLPRSMYFRACLLYHDRRFQQDPYFPFIVLNQSQIRESSVGGYILTERRNFNSVADKILSTDTEALKSLITRYKRDGFTRPENEAEQNCYDLLSLIDGVAGHVPGSNTQLAARIKARKAASSLTTPSAQSSEPLSNVDDEATLEVYPGDPTAVLPRPVPLHDSGFNIDQCPLHNGGCRKTDSSDCRARFPRELQDVTSVDPETGALLLRKRERWVNTFSVLLSYLVRCNSDVTCLLSGTMVRAVIAYVTDYVTKSSLKTHTMFEVIDATFDASAATMSGPLSTEEYARKLLVRIVNGLTAKTEIGGPMACAYLLGQPDHYTDRTFKVFFWTSYARIVANAWAESSGIDDDDDATYSDRVVVTASPSGLVPHRKANDYVFRPREMSHWCLTDFLACSDVVPLRQCDLQPPSISSRLKRRSVFAVYRFLPDHPKYSSHGVRVLAPDDHYVLNFVGPVLPRKDRGDREVYCRTMLALFCPWRTGLELRPPDVSWDATFALFSFAPRHLRLMKNMNVLYECRDSSHDFASLRRSNFGLSTDADGPQPTLQQLCDSASHGLPDGPSDMELLRLVELACTSAQSGLHADSAEDEQRRQEFRRLLSSFDTLERHVPPLPVVRDQPPSSTPPPFVSSLLSPKAWKDRLNAARKLAVSLRMNPSLQTSGSLTQSRVEDFDVRVVGINDVEPGYSSVSANGLSTARSLQPTTAMQRAISLFSLNDAQTRAVSIVTAKNAVRDAVVDVRAPARAVDDAKRLMDFRSLDKFPATRGTSSVAETRRLTPDLLREFRELEILAAATEEEFAGNLPFGSHGQSRSYVVSKYQDWKGVHYVPPNVHPALRWDTEKPATLSSMSPAVAWKLLNPAQRSTESRVPLKRAPYTG
ncbi:hypothetical protein BC629DRAFT_1663000 [Irpex lacteus]|nr:hypothetical protein BC629DRAFT_1663000 [Irpex lacteus]